MSTKYTLVLEDDFNQIAKLKEIRKELQTKADELFSELLDNDFARSKSVEISAAISVALANPTPPDIELCYCTRSHGYQFIHFGDLDTFKRWFAKKKEQGIKYLIVDEYNTIISLEDFEAMVLGFDGGTTQRNR